MHINEIIKAIGDKNIKGVDKDMEVLIFIHKEDKKTRECNSALAINGKTERIAAALSCMIDEHPVLEEIITLTLKANRMHNMSKLEGTINKACSILDEVIGQLHRILKK